MKILTLVGARPQFVKEAVIQRALKEHESVNEIVVHSGQHYDDNMSGVFFEILDMCKPHYNLNIGSGSHAEMTGKILIDIEKVMVEENPDVVLLHGDTNTTLAGAIAASKLNIPIAHIEAGLRTEKLRDVPEEKNRKLTDVISDVLYCPTQLAIDNLEKENLKSRTVFTGDVMYDLFVDMKPYFKYDIFSKLSLEEGKYMLMTLHRGFNVDLEEDLRTVLKNVAKIGEEYPVIFPAHPRTRKKIEEYKLNDLIKDRVHVIDPVNYLDLMGLLMKSKAVITDSGGVQKEAYFAEKRAYVLLPDTGWEELIKNGWNKLVTKENIHDRFCELDDVTYQPNLYGDGKAGKRIVDDLLTRYSNK